MRGYAAYRHFCLYLHKRMRTKINYKRSVAQDIDLVKLSKLYIVFYNYAIHMKLSSTESNSIGYKDYPTKHLIQKLQPNILCCLAEVYCYKVSSYYTEHIHYLSSIYF